MDFLKEVEKNLDLPLAEKTQVMKELDGHYCDLREELLESGMSASQSDQEAARKLGDPADIAQKMQSVHCRLGWNTAFLMALPVIALQFVRLLGEVLDSFLLAKRAIVHITPVLSGPAGLANPEQALRDMRLEILTGGAAALVITGLFLYPSIRDWRAGRRPVWLPTWMAAGMWGLFVFLSCVISLFISPSALWRTEGPLSLLLDLLPFLAYTAFTMWLLKDLPRWKYLAAGIAVLGVAVKTLEYSQALTSSAWMSIDLAILITAGIGAFGRRPYGNAAQASLFAWTVHAWPTIVGPSLVDTPWLLAILQAVSTVAVIVAVFIYARQSSWLRKTFVITSAMLVVALIGALPAYQSVRMAVQPAETLVLSLLFIIVVPLLYEMRVSRQKPQTA